VRSERGVRPGELTRCFSRCTNRVESSPSSLALPFLLGTSRRVAESGGDRDASRCSTRHPGSEKGWSQDAYARDASGEQVPLGSDEAIAWTLCGAFALAGKDGIPMGHLPAALRALAEVTGMESLNGWNDEATRTKKEVLDALEAAIVRVEGGDA
jgi:hypothetical protein